jgi:hypothetical protein
VSVWFGTSSVLFGRVMRNGIFFRNQNASECISAFLCQARIFPPTFPTAMEGVTECSVYHPEAAKSVDMCMPSRKGGNMRPHAAHPRRGGVWKWGLRSRR